MIGFSVIRVRSEAMKRNVISEFSVKISAEKLFETPCCRRENNIKTDVRKIHSENMNKLC
jgi:hypothetical protein